MKQYIVDAFTDKIFSGNPAAVCILKDWISDNLMLNIAIENNLSETAFIVKKGECYELRWFTPTGEIDFCGHATLASAFVIFNYYSKDSKYITFLTKIKEITVERENDNYIMIFPKYDYVEVPVTQDMIDSFSATPLKAFKSRDLLLIFDRNDYELLKPNFDLIKKLDAVCVAVSCESDEYDCVSRVFVPSMGIDEDPVTGSTHCLIAPYWSSVLGKEDILAYQNSRRGGVLSCKVLEDNVIISGSAVLFSESKLYIN